VGDTDAGWSRSSEEGCPAREPGAVGSAASVLGRRAKRGGEVGRRSCSEVCARTSGEERLGADAIAAAPRIVALPLLTCMYPCAGDVCALWYVLAAKVVEGSAERALTGVASPEEPPPDSVPTGPPEHPSLLPSTACSKVAEPP
jgi:hypothetical protein